jgi:hypothetical protein
MLGYAVLLSLSVLLSLAIAAAVLAARMRWQVRPLPVEQTPAAGATRPGEVLHYAPPPAKAPPLLDRHPVLLAPVAVLAGAVPVGMAAALQWMLTTEFVLREYVPRSAFVLSVVAMALYLAGSVVLCIAGLRRAADARPAAAQWGLLRIARLFTATTCVLLFVATMMDWKARRVALQTATRAEARVKLLGRRDLPDDRNGYVLMQRAMKSYNSGTPIQWSVDPVRLEPRIAPPPFPQDQARTLALLRAAAAMEFDAGEPYGHGVDGIVAPSVRTLQLHAINAARSGDFAQAAEDVAILQQQARGMARCPWEVLTLMGASTNNQAMRTIEAILPLVTDEEQLNHFTLPERQWYRDAGRRATLISLAYPIRETCRSLLPSAGGPARPLRSQIQIILWRDLVAADGALAIEDYQTRMLALWDIPDDCIMSQAILQRFRSAGDGPSMVYMTASTLPFYPLQSLSQRDLAEAAIAATRYRLRTGRLPQSWEELTSSGLLRAVPQDLFTGKPATMQVSADHVIFAVGRTPITDEKTQAIAASRPLWEIYGGMPATTRPGPNSR